MDLQQASIHFLNGYFSTHDRGVKTRTGYGIDLKQFQKFAGETLDLQALDGTLIERWAGHLREEGYAPASVRRKTVVLKVFCSYWVRKKELRESPFWRVKLSIGRIQQLPRTLSQREMHVLLSHARKSHMTREPRPFERALWGNTEASFAKYRA